MAIKIFHTADLHIGMKFNKYPESVRKDLQQARVDIIEKMVQVANQKECNLFVIAGDLFNGISGVSKATIHKVQTTLDTFQGECVVIIPGNHDYDNDMIDLWKSFKTNISDKIIFLNDEIPHSIMDFGLKAMIYPAPCHSVHSKENNIGWIKNEIIDNEFVNIGIAHGALEGISPDLEEKYYYMKINELSNIPIDLWLLGHTHITFPTKSPIKDWKIFNPGTPEPDGLDCKHSGVSWIITVDDEKKINAEMIETGSYQFADLTFEITGKDDLDKMSEMIISKNPSTKIARINLVGKVEDDVFRYRQEIYRKIEENIKYLIIEDTDLSIKISKEKIEKEFTIGSFPQQLLSALSDDEEALQIAYEMIMGVKR